MTKNDRLILLKNKVAESSQAAVARELGYSSPAVSQVLHGKYKAGLDAFLKRVAEVYGDETLTCPLLGEITLGQCAQHRRQARPGGNHLRVKQYRACSACPNNPKNGGKS